MRFYISQVWFLKISNKTIYSCDLYFWNHFIFHNYVFTILSLYTLYTVEHLKYLNIIWASFQKETLSMMKIYLSLILKIKNKEQDPTEHHIFFWTAIRLQIYEKECCERTSSGQLVPPLSNLLNDSNNSAATHTLRREEPSRFTEYWGLRRERHHYLWLLWVNQTVFIITSTRHSKVNVTRHVACDYQLAIN